MPDEEILTPEGTETEIEQPEAPAPAEPEPQPEPQPDLQAALEAERQAREAAERKFAESAREAQILAAKNKQYEERQSINNQPTEDDLRRNIPGYDQMVPNEQFIAAQNYQLQQKLAAIEAKEQQREADASWNRDIETFVISDPKLQGREDEFRKFANKRTHKGAPLDVLKSAFLYETPVTQPAARAPGLEPGSGGTREPEKKSLSGDDLKNLRKTNYAAYQEYIKTHDIDIDL